MKENNKSENQTYYMPLCMCLGMSIGAAIGVATDNLSIYMPIGMSIGLCIGSLIDAQKRNKAKDAPNDEETEYHCPPVQQPYWNTVYLNEFPEDELYHMIDLAYDTVLNSFSKKVRAEILRNISE